MTSNIYYSFKEMWIDPALVVDKISSVASGVWIRVQIVSLITKAVRCNPVLVPTLYRNDLIITIYIYISVGYAEVNNGREYLNKNKNKYIVIIIID